MIALTSWLGFVAVALAMVVTPGPNMAYLVSRTLCQGRRAGMISLGGVAIGFAIYALLAAFGMTALFTTVPYAYDALRLSGAIYLGYLAWNALRPGGSSPFEPRQLSMDAPRRLFGMGLLTNLLNPKIAMLYLSLFPQFVDPARGSVLMQSMLLGFTQIVISVSVNSLIVCTAGGIASFLAERPLWARAQRWFMGGVLGALAARMLIDSRRA
jgi:threonine/homoserine/homoserine lactone efflux protein